MIESVGLLGALATVGVIVGRVVVLAIALHGTRPSERPMIIRALSDFVGATRRPNRPASVHGSTPDHADRDAAGCRTEAP